MASTSSSQSKIAQKTWELANNVTEAEEIYKYDVAEQQSFQSAKPWENDVTYFNTVKVSALALLKMVMHARYVIENFMFHFIKELFFILSDLS